VSDWGDAARACQHLTLSVPSRLMSSGIGALQPASEPAHYIGYRAAPEPRAFGNVFGDEAPRERVTVHAPFTRY
jgi:hypothetical protein